MALAGAKQRALNLLEDAIHADVVYYGKAAVDPDLEGIRGEVLGLLVRLAREAENKAKEAFAAVAKNFSSLPAGAGVVRFRELKGNTGQLLRQLQEGLKNPSYSTCLRFPAAVEPLEGVGALGGLRELFSAEGTFASRSAECEDRQRNRTEFQAKPMVRRDMAVRIWWALYVLSGCVLFIPLYWGHDFGGEYLVVPNFIALWPFVLFMSFFLGGRRQT